MSRRMLLEDNYSENELMPVMDGLICWLDGRDYIIEESIWKDRSNNMNNFATVSLAVNSRGAVYCQSTKGFAECNIQTPMNYTIEVNCYYNVINIVSCLWAFGNAEKGHSYDYFWTYPDGDSLSFRRLNRGIYKTYSYLYNLTVNKKYNIITTFDYKSKLFALYVNGLLIATKVLTSYDYQNTNYIVLMSDGIKERPFNNGGIYGYKIYNRVLTEKEIQQNYEYEQSIERR